MAQRSDNFGRPSITLWGYNGWEHAYDTNFAEPTATTVDLAGRLIGPYNMPADVPNGIPADVLKSFIARPLSEVADSGTYTIEYYNGGGGDNGHIAVCRRIVGDVEKKIIVWAGGTVVTSKLSGFANANNVTMVSTGPTYSTFLNPAGVTFDLVRLTVVVGPWTGSSRTLTISSDVRRTSDYTWIPRTRQDNGVLGYGGGTTSYVITVTDTDFSQPGSCAFGATRSQGGSRIYKVTWEDGSTIDDDAHTDLTTIGGQDEVMMGLADWLDYGGMKLTSQQTAGFEFRANIPSGVTRLGLLFDHTGTQVSGQTLDTVPFFHITFWKIGDDYDTTKQTLVVKPGSDAIIFDVSAGDNLYYVRYDHAINNAGISNDASYGHEAFDFTNLAMWLKWRGYRLFGSTRLLPHKQARGDRQMDYILCLGDSLTSSVQSDSDASLTRTDQLWLSMLEIYRMIPAGRLPTSIKKGYSGYRNSPSQHQLNVQGTTRSDAPAHFTNTTYVLNSVTIYTNLTFVKYIHKDYPRYSGGQWVQGPGRRIRGVYCFLHVNDAQAFTNWDETQTATNAQANMLDMIQNTAIVDNPTTLGVKLGITPPHYGQAIQVALGTYFQGLGYTQTKVPITPNAYNVGLGCYFRYGGWPTFQILHAGAAAHLTVYMWGGDAAFNDLPAMLYAADTGSVSLSTINIYPGDSGQITVTLSHSSGNPINDAMVVAYPDDVDLVVIATQAQRLPLSGLMQVTFDLSVPNTVTPGTLTGITIECGSYSTHVAVRTGDITNPQFVSADISTDGQTLTVHCDEELVGTGTGFALEVEGQNNPLTLVLINGNQLVFAVENIIYRNDVATLTYDNGDTTDIYDNPLIEFTDQSVDNQSTQITVTSITVTPSSITVDTETEIQFTGSVVGYGDPSTVVLWTIESGFGTIDDQGLFTVPDATLNTQTIVIRGTSEQDPSFYDESTITVPPLDLPSGNGQSVTSHYRSRSRV